MKKYKRGIGSLVGIIIAIIFILKFAMTGSVTNGTLNNETASVSVCAVYNAE